MTGRRKNVAVANLGDTFSERAQNIIELSTNDPAELLSRKIGWEIRSLSGLTSIRFHITQKTASSPEQKLIIMWLECNPANSLPGKILNLIFSFAKEHQLTVVFEVSGLPQKAVDYVEREFHCERTGKLLVLPRAA